MMHKEDNNQKIFDNHGNITQTGDIYNIEIQENKNSTDPIKIESINNTTNNYNFSFFSLDWIFKKFNIKELNTKQFIFLLFSRTILFVLLTGLILLPLYSVNKNNISFFEFFGMIIVFIFLSSWLWKRIKKDT